MIWIALYVIGCIATAACFIYRIRRLGKLTLSDVFVGIVLFLCSWIAFFAQFIAFGDDIVIWKKKN